MDVTFAMEAKSDQLNAADIMGIDRIIKIRDVIVEKGADQPISILFDGDNNRPYKPSKGMVRILAGAWGQESKEWIGKSASLYFEPSVMWAGKPVGGIRIKAVSDIKSSGLDFSISINRSKREPFKVACLVVEEKAFPDDKFREWLPKIKEAMDNGKSTLQATIAKCELTGKLTEKQLKHLESIAPVEVDETDEAQTEKQPTIETEKDIF